MEMSFVKLLYGPTNPHNLYKYQAMTSPHIDSKIKITKRSEEEEERERRKEKFNFLRVFGIGLRENYLESLGIFSYYNEKIINRFLRYN